MVASIITEHPRIESRFITSPSGCRGYPNYRPGFSHIKKVALPKTSHLNKGWIRKFFAFFPSFPFWKVFCTFFSLWCFVLCWGAAVFFSGSAPRPCGGEIRSLVGFWEGSGGRNICWEQDLCKCVHVCECVHVGTLSCILLKFTDLFEWCQNSKIHVKMLNTSIVFCLKENV